MTDDQLIESLRARTWPGDCEAAAFRLEELRARVAELEALPGNVLAQRVENLEADRDALAGISKELIERLREAAAQRVASTAMIGADDLIAAADALEIATAGMNAYCDELGSCRKAAGFGSADDPMAQEGVGAFSDPLCVAAFVESQFKRIVAERDALAAELKALRKHEPVAIYKGHRHNPSDTKEFWGMANGRLPANTPLYARPVPAEPVNTQLLERISNAMQSYERHGAICMFEGSPMIYASTLTEIADIASEAQQVEKADNLVGLRGCNSRHGGIRSGYPCIYRMRTTDPGCTGCADRDEDQPTEAGGAS